ncbi:hypothetical protein [Oricola indica]|uniref:hypothetical protein n=1 Tax=Oricola indica TaxID=2872591 RepID=UPI003CCBA2BD
MRFSLVLFSTVLAAGALGGAASHLSATGQLGSVEVLVADAKSSLRDAMRKMDSSYYQRGKAYATCTEAYGSRMAGIRTNAEITLSCECFDKAIVNLRGHDRDTALMALGPGSDTTEASSGIGFTVTAEAGRVLRRCEIKPWRGSAALRGAQ